MVEELVRRDPLSARGTDKKPLTDGWYFWSQMKSRYQAASLFPSQDRWMSVLTLSLSRSNVTRTPSPPHGFRDGDRRNMRDHHDGCQQHSVTTDRHHVSSSAEILLRAGRAASALSFLNDNQPLLARSLRTALLRTRLSTELGRKFCIRRKASSTPLF